MPHDCDFTLRPRPQPKHPPKPPRNPFTPKR
jgi:hypothetical protein